MTTKNITQNTKYKILFILPFLYCIIVLVAILYNNGIFDVITSSNISLSSEHIEGIFDDLIPIFPIGLVLSIFPLIIYVIFKSKALAKSYKPDFENGIIKKGTLLSVTPTGARLNKIPIYNIEIRILDEISNTTNPSLNKTVRIASHQIHYLKINSTYNILQNQTNTNEFFINFDSSQGWI